MAILMEGDREQSAQYAFAIDGGVTLVDAWPGLMKELADHPEEVLVVVGPDVPLEPALAFAEAQRLARPALGVVLLRRRIDVTVLGAALRAGIREVVTPDDTNALADACRRSLEVSRRTAGYSGEAVTPEGEVVTVFAAKGGAGKTTVATNLAAALAGGGKRKVCLVDLDLAFGDVAIALQLFPSRSVHNAVAMQELDEAGVRSLVTPHSEGLDTVLAPLEPGDAEKIPTSVVSALLAVLRRMYDFVVVDSPPDFKETVLAALDVSDAYVLLTTLDLPALKNLRITLDMLDLLGYPRDGWQVVLNRSDSKVGLEVSDVEKTLKVPIAAHIPSSRAVSASINKGVPLVLDQPNHPVSQAIRKFAEDKIALSQKSSAPITLPDAMTQPTESGRSRRGFLLLKKAAAR
jgi:pilus assembly protein CpaE